ncbi:hypothetical protein [Catenuloplanes indicus]|uniref:Uncharacterized protein n=1 Tax=Catenuloplanes indicus TaxID=137267 RepID=A0AAE3VV45_9ACTN|nr:hypothetical protein [Catenuloplanes indicus]MDQ0363869.1 hypothetical protein [Catenuloplanes indicus]
MGARRETAARGTLAARVDERARAAAPGDAARLINRILARRADAHAGARSPVLLELAGLLAGRLRADGVPVVPPHRSMSRDLDVYDLLLAAGAPVDPGTVDLVAWFADDTPGRRDLRALASHPAVRDRFREAAFALLTRRDFGADPSGRRPLHPLVLARAMSVPGVAAALRAEVESSTARLGELPIGPIAEVVGRLAPLRSAAGRAAFGPLLDRVAGLDVAAALGRTLRAGLAEELVWPAYEQAYAELDPSRVRRVGRWPLLALYDGTSAVVLTPDGIAGRYAAGVPGQPEAAGTALCELRAGRLLVTWYDQDGGHGYWADRPETVFPLGDSDAGTLPDPPEQPPPGVRDWAVAQTAHGPVVRTSDGRELPLPPDADVAEIAGVLRLPGTDVLFTATPIGTVTIWDPLTGTAAHGEPEAGGPMWLPPAGWWHLMRPRDPAASAMLRAGTAPPAHTDRVLAGAVHRVTAEAARLAAETNRFTTVAGTPEAAPGAHDLHVTNGLSGFSSAGRPRYRTAAAPGTLPGYRTLEHLAHVRDLLRAGQGGTAGGWPDVPLWWRVLPTLGAAGLRAAMATTPEPVREALAALLTELTTPEFARARAVTVEIDHGADAPAGGIVLERLGSTPGRETIVLLTAEEPDAGYGPLRRLVELLADRGPVRWDPGWALHLPMPPATATVLLTGALYVAADDPAVPPGFLSATGLTARRERAEARKLARLPADRLRRLLHAAMPTDPERLWHSGPDTAALAAAWLDDTRHRTAASVPEGRAAAATPARRSGR